MSVLKLADSIILPLSFKLMGLRKKGEKKMVLFMLMQKIGIKITTTISIVFFMQIVPVVMK